MYYEMWVIESNCDVRILSESSEVAAAAHAQYQIGQKQSRTTGATSDSF